MGDIASFDKRVRYQGLHPGRSVRALWAFVPILSAALALVVGIARAADNPVRAPRRSHTITLIDPGLLLPADARRSPLSNVVTFKCGGFHE